MTQIQPDKSGASVVLGMMVAVLVVVGAYFFLKSQGIIATGGLTTANIEAPDTAINATEPAAGEPMGNVPVQVPARE